VGLRSSPRVVRRRRHDLHARAACDKALGVLLRAIGAVAILALLVATSLAAAPSPTPKLLETGKQVYELNCAACHGATGNGDGPVAFAVKPPPRNLVKDPFKAGDGVDQIFKTISTGLPNTRMVGYPQIEEVDRWAAAYYVRAFRIKK
jgi:high-affinity iron transporter